MERGEGTREDQGVSYYLWIPFKFIHQTFLSLLLKLFGLRTPSSHTSQEEEGEEVGVVEVSSRGLPAKPKKQQKSRASSGKPGGINKKPR